MQIGRPSTPKTVMRVSDEYRKRRGVCVRPHSHGPVLGRVHSGLQCRQWGRCAAREFSERQSLFAVVGRNALRKRCSAADATRSSPAKPGLATEPVSGHIGCIVSSSRMECSVRPRCWYEACCGLRSLPAPLLLATSVCEAHA
jgi:hypothetical protein